MSRRKDPGAAVIEFFEQAPVDAAQAVLGICKSIVKTRMASPKKPPLIAASEGLTPAHGAGSSSPSES